MFTAEPITYRQPLLNRLFVRQNAHSLFLSATALLLGATLIADIALGTSEIESSLLFGLFVFCVVFAGVTVYFGERFPTVVGLVAVLMFIFVSTYFLGPAATNVNAVSTLQELPIMALYLGWFFPPKTGRTLVFASLIIFIWAMAANPSFGYQSGVLGLVTAVHGIVVFVVCFEVGSYLWRRAERKSVTDSLTGILNRGGFMRKLQAELDSFTRSRVPRTLAVIDFDRFKELNDDQGHAAGDQALKDTVKQWKLHIRRRDVLGRTGGDEFALLIDRSDYEASEGLLRRLHESSPHAWSWGLAQVQDGDTAELLFQRADIELYRQKRSR